MNTENKCFIPGDIVICKIDNEIRFGLVISKNSKHNKHRHNNRYKNTSIYLLSILKYICNDTTKIHKQ